MICLLSPAKSLDLDSPLTTRKHSVPRLLDRAVELVEVMREKSPEDVARLMGVSHDLAVLNVERYRDFVPEHDRRTSRPAALMFDGDVYRGMAVRERFDERDWTQAQKTVRILSGLYGLLRPLDLVQPYRLEMGTRLRTRRGATLYDYWGDSIRDMVVADCEGSPGPAVVVNLASEEYAHAARLDTAQVRVVTPRFLDAAPDGDMRVVSFFAKRARGEMAAWLVRNRVRSLRALQDFDGAGYAHDRARSAPDAPVFVRARP